MGHVQMYICGGETLQCKIYRGAWIRYK